MRTDGNFRVFLVAIFLAVIVISYLSNRSETSDRLTEESDRTRDHPRQRSRRDAVVPAEESRTLLTIDGYDPDSNSIIERINLWSNYETRTRIVGQVAHGEKVFLVKRAGDGVLVERRDGLRGWLTYWFIKEYN